ncbi:acyl-CoA dehydrogenase family protein [Polycladidibacter stylochi]|uniref:acyl-CoA dehydrogenase family protein n=1 Tax=Polycladidibacter stylochi TaxID=1807766 RepID=UPI00082E5369|nr:acyl-CoA dehydrogenase family protein [Pseudovibrio stylochi]
MTQDTLAPADNKITQTNLYQQALDTLDIVVTVSKEKLRERICVAGRVSAQQLEHNQQQAHALAWLATYVSALHQLAAYRQNLIENGNLSEFEDNLIRLGFAEYLTQIFAGIPMSQLEFARLESLGHSPKDIAGYKQGAIEQLIAQANDASLYAAIAQELEHRTDTPTIATSGLDETSEQIREQMRRFAEAEVVPHAHEWHLNNAYIPLDVIEAMAELGVFSLTIPEEYGGLGLGKTAMCVVSEELSRAYIGVGSLGTRSEIAAELILAGGTEAQKQHWLPRIASGEILPTAVFTEPNTGSDLASLRTRAQKQGDTYSVNGNKTWITHPVRADIMTLLARTNPDQTGYKGLSMFIAEKPRGDDDNPFPAEGMSGGEIEVLGYRGMKEYEIAFEDFKVPSKNLLGEVEGQGFKQLMQTFEAARIQTAARAVGVAQSALESGLQYALERNQFGKAIYQFPRVANKLVLMAVELLLARQLTYFAANEKDQEHRCDLEAGMAKLLAAKVAWSCADNALQIHGGNGFALEYPVSRLLCDARILSIFEGASEIQAQVIARRILES